MNENEVIQEAKNILKAHIKFLETLLKHTKGNNQDSKNAAMYAAWCIHRYLSDNLVTDIEQAMIEQAIKNNLGNNNVN